MINAHHSVHTYTEMSYRGNFPRRGRGGFNRKRQIDQGSEHANHGVRVPTAKRDIELVTDGSATSKVVSRARDDRRLAKEWEAFYKNLFEENAPRIRLPQNSHLIPDSEALNVTLREIAQTAVGNWQAAINEHLTGLVTKANEREANPQTNVAAPVDTDEMCKQLFASEGFARLLASTIANTAKAIAAKND